MKLNLLNFKKHRFIVLLFIPIMLGCSSSDDNGLQNHVNEVPINGVDFLTPQYYDLENTSLRETINDFISVAQQEVFHHPLENSSGQIPDFSVPNQGRFGVPKGSGDSATHHPAVDLHVGNGQTSVALYAAHDGIIAAVKNAPNFRDFLSITKNILNEQGQIIGKIVTYYAHIDLALDEAEGLSLNGQQINKGDLISKNLYSETTGGPHLHFEIRYYRPSDLGSETFYGSTSGPGGSPGFTRASAGFWSLGNWHPNVGYGFADPESHGLNFLLVF